MSVEEQESSRELQTTIEAVYEGWKEYDTKLRECVASIPNEALELRATNDSKSVGEILRHIISVRAGWFSGTLQDPDDVMNGYILWDSLEPLTLTIEVLEKGLCETWAFMEARLVRWTPADCAVCFPDEWNGQIFEVSRSWVIYHVMEHDHHHGGQVSFILGINGLKGLAI
ncbi:MAG: DinB family protein [Pyrinomonadaceae bacterium]